MSDRAELKLRIPREMHDALRDSAFAKRMSLNELCRTYLEAGIATEGQES